jgi:hypothetical protein
MMRQPWEIDDLDGYEPPITVGELIRMAVFAALLIVLVLSLVGIAAMVTPTPLEVASW